jgi:hypothetical protein
LSRPRRPSSTSLFHILLLVSVAEVAINRLAVEALRPTGEIPAWHSALSYAGLFLYYFASTLAAAALLLRVFEDLREAGRDPYAQFRVLPRAITLAVLAALGAFAMASAPSDFTSFLLETVFALAVGAVVAAAVLESSDLLGSIGILLFASPLVIHYYGVLFKHSLLSPEAAFDSDLPDTVQTYGILAACIAAILSPYLFSSRPRWRALLRPAPVQLIVALIVLSAGAVLVREQYGAVLFLSKHLFGMDLGVGVPSGQLAWMLMSLAAISWTLASCALAESAPRREVGVGVALIVLGGYGFEWPLAFLLGASGLVAIGDALPRLATSERGAGPRTPPIDDATWQAYVAGLTAALRAGGDKVNAVTTRGDDDAQSTILATERKGVAIKARLERIGGALLCVDVVCGKDVGDQRIAGLTVAARPEGWMPGSHPEPPPASPQLRTGDDAFDHRFRVKGDGKALFVLLDDGMRARAAASLDGWLAYWPGESLRWRLYPGMGAPLDLPVPVSDLALRRAGSGAADRLASVIELVAEIAAKGDLPRTEPEPPAPADPEMLS